MNDKRFRVNSPTVTHETIDGEAVIINLDSGNYYSLVDVGSLIWSLIGRGASAGEVINLLPKTYQCNAADIDRCVQELLAQLQQENLIVPFEGAESLDRSQFSPEQPQNGHEKLPFNPPLLYKYSDMQELLLLDPIHDVDDTGWPKPNPKPAN